MRLNQATETWDEAIEISKCQITEGCHKEFGFHFKNEGKSPYTKINSKWIKDLNVGPKTIKLLEENIGKTLSDINHSRILYDPHPRILEIKAKINKWDLMKLKSLCTTKETISKVKRAFRMGENNSKRSNRQRINLKNIQATPVAQFQKNKWPNQKMGQRTKQTFLQRRHIDVYQTHEKMLNITHYQRNANQNHNEVPLHTSQDGCYPKVYKQ